MSDAGNGHGHLAEHGAVEIAHVEHPKVPYFFIAGTLFVMTAVTVGASFVDLGKSGNVVLALALASFKASLVMFFFMHLKYERPIMKLIAFAPMVLAGVLLFALFPDVVYSERQQPLEEYTPHNAEHHER